MFSKITAWYRIFIVLSIGWIVCVLAGLEPWRRVSNQDDFLIIGILPVVLLWGIFWIVKGFKESEKKHEKNISKKIIPKINIIKLTEGFRRIFLLVALISSIIYGIDGFYYADRIFKPTTQEIFSSFIWDNDSLEKYYETAKKDIEEIRMKKDAYAGITIDGRSLSLDDFDHKIKSIKLPSFKKNPPLYNKQIFEKTFPENLQSPLYLKCVFALVFGIVVFVFCYGALNFILFAIFWVVRGFLGNNQMI